LRRRLPTLLLATRTQFEHPPGNASGLMSPPLTRAQSGDVVFLNFECSTLTNSTAPWLSKSLRPDCTHTAGSAANRSGHHALLVGGNDGTVASPRDAYCGNSNWRPLSACGTRRMRPHLLPMQDLCVVDPKREVHHSAGAPLRSRVTPEEV
jgi:hypothetical protein